MGRDEILQRVVKILESYAEEPEKLKDASFNSHLADDLTVDSSHMVDASMEMEDEFNITLEDEEVAKMKEMSHVIVKIEEKLAG